MAFKVVPRFVVFCTLYAIHANLSAQTILAQPQYRFQHFDTKDGLAAAFVGSIAQDRLGFIWLQSYLGLSRFDGYNFKVYRHDPNDTLRSVPIGGVGSVFADPKGNLWVTAHTKTSRDFPIAKYDVDTDGFISYRAALDGSIVSQFIFDKSDPIIWFTTNRQGLYSFNTKTLETINYLNDQPDSLLRMSCNSLWGIDDRDSCLLVGSREGLWLFNKQIKQFTRPKCNPADSSDLFHAQIWDITDATTSEYRNVLALNRKFLMVDKNLSVVKHFDFPDGLIPGGYDIDRDGVFWIITWNGNGMYRYNPNGDELTHIRNIPGDMNSLISNTLNHVKVDRDQNIWVASDRGVSRLQKQNLRFYNFTLPEKMGESTVYHHNEKDFVIVNKINNNIHDFLIAPITAGSLDSLRFEKITKLNGPLVCGLWQGKNNFWISLYERGVVRLPINPESGMIIPGQHQLLSHDANNPNTISSNLTTFVWEDTDENLWVGTRFHGLNKINSSIPYGNERSVTRYRHIENDSLSLVDDIVWTGCPGGNNSLWITTDTGVDLFRNGNFEHYFKKRNSPTVYKARDGTIFLAAAGGLYEGKTSDGIYKFNQNPLLKIEDVIRIQDDKFGRLWISNYQGLVCYDPYQKFAIEFNENDGFEHTRGIQPWYKEHLTSEGLIVISDAGGISLFDPSSLVVNKEKTFPVLTSLKVNNQYTAIHERVNTAGEFSIKRNINVLDKLILDYKHNNFAIEFSAMEMTSPDKNLYRHKLEGYDKDWIETDWKNRTATYTNLDAGEYIFKVKASNHHGIWSDQETIISVHILPPPWKTGWAYALYGLALIGAFLVWRNYEDKRLKLKHRAEHLSELDKLKTNFFTNISHEFRTPITLILGPLKEMYKGTFNGDQRSVIGVMLRNAQRLLKLINQLLDLSKLEAGKMRLHVHKVETVQFLRDIASSYESLAANKAIRYFFYPEVSELATYIDSEKIEKVTHNLLSNAFKFTKEGGEIILYLKQEGKYWSISVKDTGIGIPADQLDKIFDRFYQVDSSQTREHEGSGLGMALAKELVELHHGRIAVESKEGKGTTFTAWLPLGKEHFSKDEIELNDTKKSEMFTDDVIVEENIKVEENANQKTVSTVPPLLLIVEDNTDMRHYISKILSEQYQIIEAENGKQGAKQALEIIPDLIISDVMMPQMDGYKLCECIKTNEPTSHIPIILLTAKADRESKLTGLETGADDYLSKPFDAEELKLIVRNRIQQRQKIRERFSREITLEPKHISITSFDEKFLNKVMTIIESHISDENFSIDELSRGAGYSNMHFYRKIKALTGETPSQFLKIIRLKRAAELLRAKSDNVTQIAYSVGFSSQSYFNKCFKEQFGITPRQFAEQDIQS